MKKSRITLVIEWNDSIEPVSPPPQEWDWLYLCAICDPETLVIQSWEELGDGS